MDKTPQLEALKADPPLFLRRAQDRLDELEAYGFYLRSETIPGKDPYAGFVDRENRVACHPFDLFSGNAHEVTAQRRFLSPHHNFVLERRWEYGPRNGNGTLIAYLDGRITDDEMAQLKDPNFDGQKEAGVNVGIHMIHVSRGEQGLVYKAELEAHRIIQPIFFRRTKVTDFLVPSCKYITSDDHEKIPGFDAQVNYDHGMYVPGLFDDYPI